MSITVQILKNRSFLEPHGLKNIMFSSFNSGRPVPLLTNFVLKNRLQRPAPIIGLTSNPVRDGSAPIGVDSAVIKSSLRECVPSFRTFVAMPTVQTAVGQQARKCQFERQPAPECEHIPFAKTSERARDFQSSIH